MTSTYYKDSSPLVSGFENNSVASFQLYLHQNIHEPNKNQIVAVNPNQGNLFGVIAVNDWVIREGVEPASKVIALAQGLHVGSGINKERWYCSFNLLFEDDRFKGSSLAVRGALEVDKPFDWAVVGGTGQFTFAQGFVSGKRFSQDGSKARILELSIHIVYRPLKKPNGSGNDNVAPISGGGL